MNISFDLFLYFLSSHQCQETTILSSVWGGMVSADRTPDRLSPSVSASSAQYTPWHLTASLRFPWLCTILKPGALNSESMLRSRGGGEMLKDANLESSQAKVIRSPGGGEVGCVKLY